MLMLLSISSFAKSYLTFDEFKELPKKEQLKVLSHVQNIIAVVEHRQSIDLKRAEAEKFFSKKTSSYDQKLIKLWSLIIAKAYAGEEYSFKGISGEELCLFGGWPSYKTYSPSLKYNVCVHPDRISEINGLSPEKKALGEAYDQAKAKIPCSSAQGILCNPALYGELNYCAPGKDIISAQDSSIACWMKSKEEGRNEDLLASITSNGQFSEEFHGLLKLVFGMCLCQGKYVDTDGKRKRVIAEFYSNYAMGHRTCAGLLSQVRKVTNNLKLAGTCSGLTSSSIDNVASFINNINTKIDDYLNNEMFTGNGASQAYYENYSSLGFDRTSVELAKNYLRKTATLEDDQYCNGTLYTDDEEEKILPVVTVDDDDKGDSVHITVNIDFTNSTYTENEFKLEVTTNPNIEAVSITNNVYIFNKIESDVTVTVNYTHIQTNEEILSEEVTILGKNSASEEAKLVVNKIEETNEYYRYEYKVKYKEQFVTDQTTKYIVTITNETGGDLGNLITKLDDSEYTHQFSKTENLYKVKYTLEDKVTNTTDEVIKDIEPQDPVSPTYKIKIDSTNDDKEYKLTAQIFEGSSQTPLDQVPDLHSIKWFKVGDDTPLQEEGTELTAIRNANTYKIEAKLYDSNNKEIDNDFKDIIKLDSPVVDKYEIKISSDDTVVEDNTISLVAKIYENKDGTQDLLSEIPDDHTVQWYRGGSPIENATNLTASFDREESNYAVEIKLLDKTGKDISTATADIEKKDSTNTDSDSFSISISKNELIEETYKLEATLTIDSKETTEIPDDFTVKWTITSESTDDDDNDNDNDDDDDNDNDDDDELLGALDGDDDSTVTKSGTLNIDVAQGKLTKVAKVELIRTSDDKTASDSASLDGTGIDIDDEDDDTDRTIGSNNNPYQQKMSPPMSVPKPKMILRGKDGHQGRWGY